MLWRVVLSPQRRRRQPLQPLLLRQLPSPLACVFVSFYVKVFLTQNSQWAHWRQFLPSSHFEIGGVFRHGVGCNPLTRGGVLLLARFSCLCRLMNSVADRTVAGNEPEDRHIERRKHDHTSHLYVEALLEDRMELWESAILEEEVDPVNNDLAYTVAYIQADAQYCYGRTKRVG